MVGSKKAQPIENGDILFLYRPGTGRTDAQNVNDVQRFYVVLRPHRGTPPRLMIIGDRKLPDRLQTEPSWGFVELVAEDFKRIEEELGSDSYRSWTQGDREQPAALSAGQGSYALTTAKGDEMRLSYILELPNDIGPVQKAFNIGNTGAFVVSTRKNVEHRLDREGAEFFLAPAPADEKA